MFDYSHKERFKKIKIKTIAYESNPWKNLLWSYYHLNMAILINRKTNKINLLKISPLID